jgi:hypothetical protein
MMMAKGIAPEVMGASISKHVNELEGMTNKMWDALETAQKEGVLKIKGQGIAALHSANVADRSARQMSDILGSIKGKAGRRAAIEAAQQPIRESLQKQADSLATSLEKTMQRGYESAAKVMEGVKGGTPEGAAAGLEWMGKAETPDLLRNVAEQLRSGVFDPKELERTLRPVLSKARNVSVAIKLRELAKLQGELITSGRKAVNKWSVDVAEYTGKAQAMQAKAARQRFLAADFMERAAQAESKALRPSGELIKASAELSKFRAAQDNLPNWIMRTLREEARDHLKEWGFAGADSPRAWRETVTGNYEREMAERLVDGNQQTYKRARSIPEIEKSIKEADPGTSLEMWRDVYLEKKGGLFNALDSMFGREKGIIEKIYDLDPIGNINRMADNMRQAIRGKALVDVIRQSEDLFSKEALSGWVPVSKLGTDIAKSLAGADMKGFIHPELFQELRRVYGNLTDPKNRTILETAWNKFTKFWKWSVTRAFPAYHARNHIEDTIRMVYNGPFDPVAVHDNMVKGITKKGTIKMGALGEMPVEKAWRIAEAHGVVNTGQVAVGGVNRGDGTWRTIARGADAIFQAPEDGRRFGYFVERVNKGFSLYQSGQEVKKVLFDYSDLSVFERRVMSQIIPFYTYLKNTVRLHAQTAIQNPGLLQAQRRVIEGLRGEYKPENVPQWVQSRLFVAAGPGERTNEERLVAGYGLPVQDIMELLDGQGGFVPWVKQLAWRAHPILKFPVEITSAALAERPGYAPRVFKHLPQSAKDMMGVRTRKAKDGTEYVTIDPIYSTLLDTIGSRLYSTIKSFGRDDTTYGRQALRHLLGASVVDYDPAEEKRRKGRAELDALLQKAKRTGDLAPVNAFFAPSTSQMPKRMVDMLRAQQKALRKP